MKNITTTKIIVGVTLLVLAVLSFKTYTDYSDLRASATPEALAAADKFAAEVVDLQPGDIVNLTHGAYMVETHDIYPSLLIVSGPGPESNPKHRKNAQLDGNRIWREIATGQNHATIIRKTDPGWEQNATWFHLQ